MLYSFEWRGTAPLQTPEVWMMPLLEQPGQGHELIIILEWQMGQFSDDLLPARKPEHIKEILNAIRDTWEHVCTESVKEKREM